jgi:putative GTP pyrophosphokinase
MTPEELTQRTVRFYNRYEQELDSIRQLLHIQLSQLALSYTLEYKLPRNAVRIASRTKKLNNFISKLARIGWPEFYLPTEVVHDLIGARIICWFYDDCYGLLEFLKESKRIEVLPGSIEDYNISPKVSGYRAIHLLCNVTYDQVVHGKDKHEIIAGKMNCEIQIRTLFQDAWGELTHQMHYKVTERWREQYNDLVASLADRLAAEDKATASIRTLTREKDRKLPHTGFRSR